MKTKSDWTRFLDDYTRQYAGRRTRLGLFELNGGVVNDYWLEDGLPLGGITAEFDKQGATILVSVGNVTHKIDDAIKLTAHLTPSGCEDGLDILDRCDRTTILRFER